MMITAKPDTGTSLEIKRTFKAPREAVFRAWTDPERIKQWFSPEGYENPGAEIDLRVGGRYRIAMRRVPDGEVFYVAGEYLEVIAPERLTFTWQWERDPVPKVETRVTVEFRETVDGTEVTLIHELFPAADLRDRHNEGWTSCLTKLTARAASVFA